MLHEERSVGSGGSLVVVLLLLQLPQLKPLLLLSSNSIDTAKKVLGCGLNAFDSAFSTDQITTLAAAAAAATTHAATAADTHTATVKRHGRKLCV